MSEARQPVPPARPAEEPASKPVRVLLVEDNPGDARLARLFLAENPHELHTSVHQAPTLEKAMEALECRAFDIILLDLSLPDSHGPKTFAAIHAKARHLPIIILSGQSDEELAIRLLKEGAQDHLSKDDLNANLIARSIRYAIERKHIVEQLRATQMQLIQAEKMESVGRLAAGVAHEVKNPLARIQLGLDYLREGIEPDDPNLPRIFERMQSAVQRADSIVCELVNFSSDRQLDLRENSVAVIVDNALMLVDHELKRNSIAVEVRIPRSLPPVRVDASKMEQVLINLLLNSVQAMGESGIGNRLAVTAESALAAASDHQPGDRAGSGFRAGDPVVIIDIDDNGPGIPPEILGKLFDPFFTTKPTGVGTGLGLTVVQKIIELHRGQVVLENRPDGGAKARIILPAAGAPRSRPAI